MEIQSLQSIVMILKRQDSNQNKIVIDDTILEQANMFTHLG